MAAAAWWLLACAGLTVALHIPAPKDVSASQQGKKAVQPPVASQQATKAVQPPVANQQAKSSPQRMIGNEFLLKSVGEERVMAAILSQGSGKLVIDVGANKGAWTFDAVKQGHPVYAFEPDGRNAKDLTAKVAAEKLEGKVTFTQAAVSDKPGTTTFMSHPQRDDWGGVGLKDDKDGKRDAVTVNMTSLDATVPKDTDILVLKTDTQGWEQHVLRGAQGLLQSGRVQYVYFEFDKVLMQRSGENGVAVLDFVAGFGYKCYDHTWNKMASDSKMESRDGSFDQYVREFKDGEYTDLLCMKQGDLANFASLLK